MTYIPNNGTGSDCVRCVYCCEASSKNLFPPTRTIEKAFLEGFNNWKKGSNICKHSTSEQHKIAVSALLSLKEAPISSKIDNVHKTQQVMNAKALEAMFQTVIFILSQGLPFQGNIPSEGLFSQLLHFRSADIPSLRDFLSRRNNWASHDIQNEMISIVSFATLETLCSDVRNGKFFSILADCSQDICGKEQLSIIYRYVDYDYNVKDMFVGFYCLPSSQAAVIASAINDSAIRLQLDMNHNRGLGFDGANNMSGAVGGVRALIQKDFPSSLYFHCGNHSLDLCVQDVCKEEEIIWLAMEHVHKVATFVRGSGKRLQCYERICKDMEIGFEEETSDEHDTFTTITALPFTRWVHRVKGLQCWKRNWAPISNLLEEVSKDSNAADARHTASGLLKCMRKFKTYLGVCIAVLLLENCEVLGKQLQGLNTAAASINHGSHILIQYLQSLRSEQVFSSFYQSVADDAAGKGIQVEDETVRIRKIAKRYDENSGNAHQFSNFLESSRAKFFACVDRLVNSITERLVKVLRMLHLYFYEHLT